MNGHVWRVPFFPAVMAGLALLLFTAGVMGAVVIRRNPSVPTRRGTATILVLLAIGSAIVLRTAATLIARSLDIDVADVEPGLLGYLVPMMFAALAFAVGNWMLEGAWTGRRAVLFYVCFVGFTMANAINRCSPGWCTSIGFPFTFHSESDAIITFGDAPVMASMPAVLRGHRRRAQSADICGSRRYAHARPRWRPHSVTNKESLMRCVLTIVAGILLAMSSIGAQSGTSVLFIGNSFTFAAGSPVRFYRANTVTDLNNEGIGGVPALFKSFTQQAGLDYSVFLETRGGSGLDFHLKNKLDVIGSRAWDMVVMHGYSTLDAREAARSGQADCHEQADGGRSSAARNPKVKLYLMATWSRADQTYPPNGRVGGQPIEAMARDVRAAYDKAAAGAAAQGGDPGRRGVDARDADWRGRSESVRRHRSQANSISGPTTTITAVPTATTSRRLIIFGTLTGRDPRSLGDNECSAFELGFARPQVKALQQVAFDQLAGAGSVTPASLAPAKPGGPQRCVQSR